jgi:hypothetical protein
VIAVAALIPGEQADAQAARARAGVVVRAALIWVELQGCFTEMTWRE